MTTSKTLQRTVLLLAALTVCAATSARAQFVRETPAPTAWTTFLGTQLAQSLQAPSEEIKNKAMAQTIYFARYGQGVDLSATVAPLIALYRHDADEQLRLAAVAALHAIGDETGMQALRQGVLAQPSERVQRVTLGALMDHYGPATFAGSPEVAMQAEALLDRPQEPAPTVADNR